MSKERKGGKERASGAEDAPRNELDRDRGGPEATGIFALLREEHSEVLAFLAAAVDSAEDELERRRTLFAAIKNSLLRHARMEDAVFYSALEMQAELSTLIDQLRGEHHDIEGMLADLSRMPVNSQVWMETVERLRRDVQKHIDVEERQVFPRALALLSREDARALERRYETRRGDNGGMQPRP